MSDRIYSGEEARALREAATPGPWGDAGWGFISREGDESQRTIHRYDWQQSQCEADAHLIAAAPDLARSVEYHEAEAKRQEARALKAEAERDAWDRVWDSRITDADMPGWVYPLLTDEPGPVNGLAVFEEALRRLAAAGAETDRLQAILDRPEHRRAVLEFVTQRHEAAASRIGRLCDEIDEQMPANKK